MELYQALIILVFVILIVWWALRRSASESAKEAPTGHAHAEHAEPEVPEAHAAVLYSEVAAVEPAPEIVMEKTETAPIVLPEPEPFVVPEPEPFVVPEPEPFVVPEPEPFVVPEPAPFVVPEPEPFVVAQRASEPITFKTPEIEIKPDDLVIIEGIGPRISGVLKNNGVKTFAQLAAMQPDEIKAILSAVDERLARISNPTTWPEQAALAAKGDLEGLQKLQDSLKGGRA